jgi:glycosyltransferase involved in cell wall biosynthesis
MKMPQKSKSKLKNKKLWIIIPAYNESRNIQVVLEKVKKYCQNIVVVDDGSKDNAFEIAKKEGVIALQHMVNMGKGAALKTGCDFAVEKGADILIAIDSDGQHDPAEIPNFLEALKDKDIVFGCRKLNQKMPLLFRYGNFFINKSTEILFGLKLHDTQSGYRAFTKATYQKIRWKACDYSVESEMIARVGKHHLKYAEIPIETIYADKYKGTTIIDGFKIVFNMIVWRIGL